MPSSPISRCTSCPPHAAGGHGCAVSSSSVTEAQWAILEPLLPAPGSTAGRGGRPEKHCQRRMAVGPRLPSRRGGSDPDATRGGAAGRSIRSVTARRSSTGPGVAPTFDRSRRTDLQLTHQSMQFRSTVTRDAAFASALTAQSPWTMTISVLEATGVQHDWLWPIVTEAEL